ARPLHRPTAPARSHHRSAVSSACSSTGQQQHRLGRGGGLRSATEEHHGGAPRRSTGFHVSSGDQEGEPLMSIISIAHARNGSSTPRAGRLGPTNLLAVTLVFAAVSLSLVAGVTPAAAQSGQFAIV